MAVFSDALVMQIRGDSSHLLAELQRSRQALAALRRDFQQLQQEQALAASRNAALANSTRAAAARPLSVTGDFAARRLRSGGVVPGNPPSQGSLFSGPGSVRGPSGIDRVPALLSAGEFVMSRPAVERFGVRFMEQMNAQRFQQGGLARSLPFGFVPRTQQGRLRFLGLNSLSGFLDQAVRLFDLGRSTGDSSFLGLRFPIQQMLANFRLLLSDRNRQTARNALSPLDTELRNRPDALRAVLSLIAAPELRTELLRLLGFENPQAELASLQRRSASPFEGSGTELDPFQVGLASQSTTASSGSAGSTQAIAPSTSNRFGDIRINVRDATGVGDILRQLQLRGITGRLRRGG